MNKPQICNHHIQKLNPTKSFDALIWGFHRDKLGKKPILPRGNQKIFFNTLLCINLGNKAARLVQFLQMSHSIFSKKALFEMAKMMRICACYGNGGGVSGEEKEKPWHSFWRCHRQFLSMQSLQRRTPAPPMQAFIVVAVGELWRFLGERRSTTCNDVADIVSKWSVTLKADHTELVWEDFQGELMDREVTSSPSPFTADSVNASSDRFDLGDNIIGSGRGPLPNLQVPHMSSPPMIEDTRSCHDPSQAPCLEKKRYDVDREEVVSQLPKQGNVYDENIELHTDNSDLQRHTENTKFHTGKHPPCPGVCMKEPPEVTITHSLFLNMRAGRSVGPV
ncbi:hypothetical protein SUGI_0526500 [Cryptomeria japonica]|nr:hypothetical protein SUGI_0526500 [Cryptomeria japonica]